MKLIAVKIHNFRGVLDVDLTLHDYSLLVGPNNSGKSSIIDAVRAFYEKDGFKFKQDNDFPLLPVTDKESWIELSFKLTDDEHESLADDYKSTSKELRVRKFFITGTKTHDGKSASGSIFGYKVDGALSNEPFYGAKNVQSGKFGDLIYIPAVSKVDEHTKLSGPSAMRDLLTDIMANVIEGSQAYTAFANGVKKFSDAIKTEKTSDQRSLAGFEDGLNDLLKPWQTKFNLKFPPPSSTELIKSMMGWDLSDQAHGKPQPIEYYGSGFQRHFIYSLIQLGSNYVGKKLGKKTKDFVPSMTLILFEEPEAFLHPPQQEILARNLVAVASKESWQVVCATHSSHFVSRNSDNIPAIIRLRRDDGKVSKFQISKSDWDVIVNANQAINALAQNYSKMQKKLQADDFKPEMEAVKQFLWLNPDRASLFFANHVLLVEGVTEVAFINKLVGDGRLKNADCGLYACDCLGKYNIHRFMNLLNHLGVSYSVLHDDDNNKDEHAEVNQLIADTKSAKFTFAIKQIKGDLETFLAIPSPGHDHRKPQHMLYMYESGKIAQDKLNSFCNLIDECLPK